MPQQPGRAVAEGNTQELLKALVDGRKYIRDVFIELDRCFEDGTDQLRTKSEIEDDLLSIIAIHVGDMEHALQVLAAHIAGYSGEESEKTGNQEPEKPI